MEKKDIFNFDYITVHIKFEREEEITKYYNLFGWEIVEKKDNKKYADLVDITFSRPHKIKDKDSLQLLQVHMEEKLNEIGRLERNKNALLTVIGINIAVLAILFLALGILGICKILPINIYFTIISFILSASFIIIEAVWFPKQKQKKDNEFSLKHKHLSNELNKICKTAAKLRSDKNE